MSIALFKSRELPSINDLDKILSFLESKTVLSDLSEKHVVKFYETKNYPVRKFNDFYNNKVDKQNFNTIITNEHVLDIENLKKRIDNPDRFWSIGTLNQQIDFYNKYYENTNFQYIINSDNLKINNIHNTQIIDDTLCYKIQEMISSDTPTVIQMGLNILLNYNYELNKEKFVLCLLKENRNWSVQKEIPKTQYYKKINQLVKKEYPNIR